MDMGDCMNYMLRCRFGRILFRGRDFTPRPCSKDHFERGDVVIVNDNCKHYAGEVQVVLKDMKNDGQRNLVGYIDPDEIMILESIRPMDMYSFIVEE